MNAVRFLAFSMLVFFLSSCDANDDGRELPGNESTVEVTIHDFPRIDCSTSTQPLSVILAAKTLGLPYKWWNNGAWDGVWYVGIDYDKASLPEEEADLLKDKLNCSTTHGSYTNLIDGNVDLIVASRNMSRDEKSYADEKGVQLLEHPIGRDAFVFIVNESNGVNNLSVRQVQGIYTGEIRNWKEVGGADAMINPYIRNANSGSQEKMETMVMAGLAMIDWPEMEVGGMAGPFYAIYSDENGIAYTPYYYFNIMAREWTYARSLSVDGVAPSQSTINDDTYPYVSEIYAAVRADVDRFSWAYKLFEFLTTEAGQAIVEESGYVSLAPCP